MVKNRSVIVFCQIVKDLAEKCLRELDHRIRIGYDKLPKKPRGCAAHWHLPVLFSIDGEVFLETTIRPAVFEVEGDGDGGGEGGQRWCQHFALDLVEQGIKAYMDSPAYEKLVNDKVVSAMQEYAKSILDK